MPYGTSRDLRLEGHDMLKCFLSVVLEFIKELVSIMVKRWVFKLYWANFGVFTEEVHPNNSATCEHGCNVDLGQFCQRRTDMYGSSIKHNRCNMMFFSRSTGWALKHNRCNMLYLAQSIGLANKPIYPCWRPKSSHRTICRCMGRPTSGSEWV